VRLCSMWVLVPMKELGDRWMGLGSAWDLLRMSVGNTVLVNWGELVASGRGSRSGGLVGLGHVDCNRASDFLHVFRRARVVEIVIAVVLHVLLIVLLTRGYDDLDFTAQDQVEAVATGGFLETGEARPITPLVQFPTKGIGFDLEDTKFTSGNQPVTARSMDVGDRGVNDSRLGGTTNLR
jgi:hypothetical protein